MTITARHALVTGSSRGIGRAIALKLADHGVHVAINYLKDERSANATLEQVRAAHPTMDFDGRYGSNTGSWTTDMFVEAVYKSLKGKE